MTSYNRMAWYNGKSPDKSYLTYMHKNLLYTYYLPGPVAEVRKSNSEHASLKFFNWERQFRTEGPQYVFINEKRLHVE